MIALGRASSGYSRRFRLAFLVAMPVVLPVLVVGSVRYLSPVERLLAERTERSVRGFVYELAPRQSLRLPIEPGTDVLRVVAHLMARRAGAPVAHRVRFVVRMHGAGGRRTEELTLALKPDPGRVVPEEEGLAAGEPTGMNLDVRSFGPGELNLELLDVEDGDGVLVRAYRREASPLPLVGATQGKEKAAQTERLARSAGELDWVDLPDSEREVLIGAPWKKVAALAGAELRQHAVMVSPPPSASSDGVDDTVSLAAIELDRDERVGLVLQGPVHLSAETPSSDTASIRATIREMGGEVRTIQASGELTINVPIDRRAAVEIEPSESGTLLLRGSDPSRIELGEIAKVWRTTPTRPVVVAAGVSPLVLRVRARRPATRGMNLPLAIALNTTIAHGRSGGSDVHTVLSAESAPSKLDRYDEEIPAETPSEPVSFYFLVPPKGTATFKPTHGALDLTVAELDPWAVRSSLPLWDPQSGPLWSNDHWVMRLPTNARDFESGATTRLREAPRAVLPAAPKPGTPSFRFPRPSTKAVRLREGRTFVPTFLRFPFDFARDTPAVVAVRLYAEEPVEVVARIDGEQPRRNAIGVPTRITTPRVIAVSGEVQAILVLGDDLRRGHHELSFEVTKKSRKPVWVHLPWIQRTAEPHWVEGNFE